MTLYIPGDPDAELLLGQTYVELQSSGNLQLIFCEPPSLGTFLSLFRPPTALLFEHDMKGIYILCWLEPVLRGGTFALWIRQDHRHSPLAYRAYLKALVLALRAFPVVLGITGQETLVAQHERFGYTLRCKIDHLYGTGHPGWLLEVEKDRIYARVRRHNGWSVDDRELLTECWQ